MLGEPVQTGILSKCSCILCLPVINGCNELGIEYEANHTNVTTGRNVTFQTMKQFSFFFVCTSY